jgi:FlaG/FlaF family flagellin (archaellin)
VDLPEVERAEYTIRIPAASRVVGTVAPIAVTVVLAAVVRSGALAPDPAGTTVEGAVPPAGTATGPSRRIG